MFEKYIEQILKVFNYVDSALITDDKGIIQYYYTRKNDMNLLEKDQVVGKHILSVYDNITYETSTVLQVLRTGKPVYNLRQELTTFKGGVVRAITSTLPIMDGNQVIGSIDISSYDRETIVVSPDSIRKELDLYTLNDIVTVSPEMIELKDKIQKVSETDSSVLIYGETGSGKELVAQSIHTAGKRSDKPFISQNCSAIPSTLLESILFGTVKGSFTGAENRKGLFELADGGTLFLDEISSMELSIQGKLLKAIEEKTITRVGGNTPIHVDVKIVSATNEPIESCLKSGKIRPDLLYRLSVVRLAVPPLRDRKIDIGPLTRYFIDLYNVRMSKKIIDVEDDVYDIFNEYNWPGNVRELRAAIEGAFNISGGRFIGKHDIPEYLLRWWESHKRTETALAPDRNEAPRGEASLPAAYGEAASKTSGSLKDKVEAFERALILEALRETKNKADAARALGLTKQALNYKLEKYRIDD